MLPSVWSGILGRIPRGLCDYKKEQGSIPDQLKETRLRHG